MAENSGGVHCLKYGLTLHNVLRVRGLTAAGEPVEFGSEALDAEATIGEERSTASSAPKKVRVEIVDLPSLVLSADNPP